MPTPLHDVVATSNAVASTRARGVKIATLAELFSRLDPAEVAATVGFLVGQPRQGRIGIGWASLAAIDVAPAPAASLDVGDVDIAITELAALGGAGSQSQRATRLAALFARATDTEQSFVRGILTGQLRQGALDGIIAEGVARAAGVPVALLRRAAMLGGNLGAAAELAITAGSPALQAVGLTVLRPIQPMLAAGAPSVREALELTGPASVEWKLDGARVQVHRSGGDVRVYTRNLNDITERLPDVVALAAALPVREIVLDGEVVGVHDDDAPARFQDTMTALGREPGGPQLRALFFDVLHHDGVDLIDQPLSARRELLESIPGLPAIPALRTDDPDLASRFAERALTAGQEGVVVKSLDAPYDAGRRGGSWRKVKPVRTLDLVVLAAEWGHGRRRGWLSNLHLGARGPAGTFVMVGKTFKGLTDELLAWQTDQLQARALGAEGITVHVRPELVVEIALDGVQVSRRYPGGVALRFARVRRYRSDKTAADADPIEAVQALLGGS